MTSADDVVTRQVVDQFMSRVATDLCDAIDELADDEVTWGFPASLTPAPTWEGKATVLRRMSRVVTNFAPGSMRLRLGPTVVDGPNAAVEFHLEAESFNGVPYSNDYVFVFVCAGDRLVSVHEHTDTKTTLDWLQAIEDRKASSPV